MRDTGWFKSTYSNPASDACVEVRITDDAARVRDSKNPASGHLVLDRRAFAALVAGLAR
jgi:hypothetical protein